MGLRIRTIVIDSNEPQRLVEFWAAATGRDVRGPDHENDPYTVLRDPAGRDATC